MDSASTTTTVVSALSTLATNVATQGQQVITTILPIAAPLIAAFLAVQIGMKVIKRFMKG